MNHENKNALIPKPAGELVLGQGGGSRLVARMGADLLDIVRSQPMVDTGRGGGAWLLNTTLSWSSSRTT
jgi:hypothetical protein